MDTPQNHQNRSKSRSKFIKPIYKIDGAFNQNTNKNPNFKNNKKKKKKKDEEEEEEEEEKWRAPVE